VEQLYNNSLFLKDLFDLLTLRPTITDPEEPVPAPSAAPRLRYRNVSFRYADGHADALRNFDVTIEAGTIVALVGANGSGKSTLVKLLCRFYDPDSGGVEMDGIDIRKMRVNDVRRSITVLFQEPVRYNDTVAENIAMGCLAQQPVSSAIHAAAKAACAEEMILNLPQAYDTRLGRAFEAGCDLSVGEWQRIALSRAVLRKSPVLILDEPTSAMDSWAEAEWLTQFRRVAQGQTTMVITHRFTTAMYADVIHVISEGRVIESGTHEELLRHAGKYAESWLSQQTPQAGIHV